MFAKLFDTPHGQLLVTKEQHEEEDFPVLRARGEDYKGVGVGIDGHFTTELYGDEAEATRDRNFDAFTQEEAYKTAAELRRMVQSLVGGEG